MSGQRHFLMKEKGIEEKMMVFVRHVKREQFCDIFVSMLIKNLNEKSISISKLYSHTHTHISIQQQHLKLEIILYFFW